jgi:CRP-like cAMP-binding protein
MPGQFFDRLGFVDSGVFRNYIINTELEEASKYFMRQNQFLMDIESFYDGSPTTSGMQAVTEACLFSIGRKEWLRLSEEIPKLFILTKSLTESALINKIKDNDFLHFGTARRKYEEFVRRYPDLALSVPQQYIASYLQITPQSLSRIRNNLSRR